MFSAATRGGYFGVTGLTNNTKYFFTVAAYDASGNESALSALASATPSVNGATPGSVWFDQAYYYSNATAIVTVQDAGFNSNTNTVQTMSVQITSGSDSYGIPLTLT